MYNAERESGMASISANNRSFSKLKKRFNVTLKEFLTVISYKLLGSVYNITQRLFEFLGSTFKDPFHFNPRPNVEVVIFYAYFNIIKHQTYKY